MLFDVRIVYTQVVLKEEIMPSKKLTKKQKDDLLLQLEERFKQNIAYHKNIKWDDVYKRIVDHDSYLFSLYQMEVSGGEPDVVDYDTKLDAYLYVDCATESPKGRVNLCYDRQALESRKKFKPENNVIDVAQEMGIEVLDEAQYRFLQTLNAFDLKTSSWIKTPDKIRKLGGALFCDRRYDTVFVYHNGAESYYSGRGFRGILRVK